MARQESLSFTVMRSQHNPAFDSILEGGPLPLYVPSNDGLPGPFPDFDLYYSSTNTTFTDPFTMLKPTTTFFGHGPSEEHLKSLLLGQDLGQRVKGPQAVPSLSSSGPFGLGSSNATSDVEHLNDPAMQALYTYEADVADMIASDKLCHRAEDALRNRQAQWHNRKPAYSPAQILLDSFKRYVDFTRFDASCSTLYSTEVPFYQKNASALLCQTPLTPRRSGTSCRLSPLE